MKMSYFRMMKYEQCFSPVSLCGVEGLAETFPSFPVSGPFLTDVPVFQVPPDNIFPPQPRSSSRALPLHLHFDNCPDVFYLISSFDVPEPFQPSHSHNHRYRSHHCYLKISSFLRCSNKLTHITHRTILISVVAIRLSSLTEHWPCFAAVKQRRSNRCLVYQKYEQCKYQKWKTPVFRLQ